MTTKIALFAAIQEGLLLSDEVDEWTGYRYYSIGQMQKLKDIRDLQRLGFSLDEISKYLLLPLLIIHKLPAKILNLLGICKFFINIFIYFAST